MKSDNYCEYCKHNTYTVEDWSFCKDCGECHNGEDVEMNFEGIEAIPVEHVARIITRITNKMPCDIADEMCPREDGTCGESACWEYAIKEGWFGE